MGYINKEQMRQWQLNWLRERRQKWLTENGPCANCGSDVKLEIDHRNPQEKIAHAVWSWSEPRRLAELSKCQVLCADCHKQKSNFELRRNRKLTESHVFQIWDLHQSGRATMGVSKELGLDRNVVRRVLNGQRYQDFTDQYFAAKPA